MNAMFTAVCMIQEAEVACATFEVALAGEWCGLRGHLRRVVVEVEQQVGPDRDARVNLHACWKGTWLARCTY